MKQIFNFHENPSVAKSVLMPEVERLQKATEYISSLFTNPAISLQEISKYTNMSLTEMRYNGWERLYNYIRNLENKVKQTEAELEAQNQKMRELVIFVEETSQKIVKLYRESTLRNPNE